MSHCPLAELVDRPAQSGIRGHLEAVIGRAVGHANAQLSLQYEHRFAHSDDDLVSKLRLTRTSLVRSAHLDVYQPTHEALTRNCDVLHGCHAALPHEHIVAIR